MSYQQYYGGAIWTNHALDRLSRRGLSQNMAWKTFRYPDESSSGKKTGTMEFRKKIGTSVVTIIGKRNDNNEWIILSCWVDPPFPGSIDIKNKENYKKYRKASFWGKFWITFKKQLGF